MMKRTPVKSETRYVLLSPDPSVKQNGGVLKRLLPKQSDVNSAIFAGDSTVYAGRSQGEE